MIKKLYLTMLCILLSAAAFAQGPTLKQLQENDKYIYGIGKAATRAKAHNFALEELISSISTNMAPYFPPQYGADNHQHADVASLTKTYLKTLTNRVRTADISDLKDKENTVVLYITKEDIVEMFNERIEKVRHMVESAQRATKRNQIGTALQKYYWALALLGSCPDGDKLCVCDDDFYDHKVSIWIPDLINELLSKISIKYVNVEKDTNEKYVTVEVTYNGVPVDDDLSFTCNYANGGESELVVTRNGIGMICLPIKANEKKLIANIDYRGVDIVNNDKELADVIGVCGTTINVAGINLKGDIKKKQNTTYADVEQAKLDVMMTSGPKATEQDADRTKTIVHYLNSDEAAPYIPVAQKIEQILRTRQFDQLQSLCTPNGWAHVQKLLQDGNARMIDYPHIQFLDLNGNVTVRSYPMSFKFKDNRRFREDVVFHLNHEGKITQLAFAIDKSFADDIFCHSDEWGDNSKQALVNFIEKYKTAYALRDIEYIGHVITDDSPILYGWKVNPNQKESRTGMTQMTHGERTGYEQKDYMKNLKKAFSSNDYINLKFRETTVTKLNFRDRNGEIQDVYGIQFHQKYSSEHYYDSGYLTLFVEITDAAEPQILFRKSRPTEATEDWLTEEEEYF